MANEDNPTGIRCPGERVHTVKGTEYKTCGSMLFGVNPNVPCDTYIQCRVCKRWYHVLCDGEGNFDIEEQPDGKNIKFSSRG